VGDFVSLSIIKALSMFGIKPNTVPLLDQNLKGVIQIDMGGGDRILTRSEASKGIKVLTNTGAPVEGVDFKLIFPSTVDDVIPGTQIIISLVNPTQVEIETFTPFSNSTLLADTKCTYFCIPGEFGGLSAVYP
jgi:hypothetical protein